VSTKQERSTEKRLGGGGGTTALDNDPEGRKRGRPRPGFLAVHRRRSGWRAGCHTEGEARILRGQGPFFADPMTRGQAWPESVGYLVPCTIRLRLKTSGGLAGLATGSCGVVLGATGGEKFSARMDEASARRGGQTLPALVAGRTLLTGSGARLGDCRPVAELAVAAPRSLGPSRAQESLNLSQVGGGPLPHGTCQTRQHDGCAVPAGNGCPGRRPHLPKTLRPTADHRPPHPTRSLVLTAVSDGPQRAAFSQPAMAARGHDASVRRGGWRPCPARRDPADRCL
jgi:hypothetical protein